jgi:hypothetical protein
MRDVTTDTQWSVSDPTLAAIESAPQMAGVLLALREGSVLVRAAFAGKSAETTLTITAAALQSVAISTPTSSVPVGTTLQLTATATFSDGSTADVTSQAIWSVGVIRPGQHLQWRWLTGLAHRTEARQCHCGRGLSGASLHTSVCTLRSPRYLC